MNIADATRLRELILRERHAGIVTMDVRSCGALSVDAYVTSLGFKPLADGWCSLDREKAFSVLRKILERDLAYDSPLIDTERARALAEKFLTLFSPDAQYYTNGSVDAGSFGWNPITKSTFDHGVVARDDQNIGIIWVQDED